MSLPFLRTRVFQVTILVLQIVSAAQVLWWIIDQSLRTEELRQRLTDLYEQDAEAAQELRKHGADEATLVRLYPHLDADGEIRVAPGVLDSLREDRARWLNQYGWEGSFFLVVLAISMAAVWQALREEAILRRRQQNFVATVSHELKSPLARMQLSLETLSLRHPLSQRVRELVDGMTADVARMKDMITKILDASRLDQRQVVLWSEPVALLTMVARSLDELEQHPHRSSARVEVEVAAGLEVFADPVGVSTVLRNLFDNAFRSVAAQGGGEVRIRAQPGDRFVHLTVEDDGVGFPPEESTLLFDKFYRPGDELHRKGGGQGLGLYIVQRFIQLEKGRVSARSDGIGKGATFEVWWPAAKRGAA